MTVHQVRNQSSCCFGQVAGVLLNDLMEGDALEEDDFLPVGRELKALNLTICLRQLATFTAVNLHLPHLSASHKGNGLVVEPDSIGLALLGVGRKGTGVSAVCIHYIEHLLALVVLHTVVANLVDYVLTIGRCSITSDASHCPKGLRCHLSTFDANVLLSNSHVFLCFCVVASRD